MSTFRIKIKCVQHGQIISPSTAQAKGGPVQVFHERHGSRCESQTFTRIEEAVINRETALAELIRLKLESA
jgi:hypothetical protein